MLNFHTKKGHFADGHSRSRIELMGFLKRIFGSDDSKKSGKADAEGFFVYVRCDQCGEKVRLRIHKQYDLIPSDDGYKWHKTIVDSRCFQRIPTVANFDRSFNLVNADIQGGRFISKEEYEMEEVSQPTDEDKTES